MAPPGPTASPARPAVRARAAPLAHPVPLARPASRAPRSAGNPGANGAAAIGYTTVVDATQTFAEHSSLADFGVHCPPGLIAIQGGFQTTGETVTVNGAVSAFDASISVPDAGDPGQWDFTIVTANNHTTVNHPDGGFPTFPVTMPVAVTCARPGN